MFHEPGHFLASRLPRIDGVDRAVHSSIQPDQENRLACASFCRRVMAPSPIARGLAGGWIAPAAAHSRQQPTSADRNAQSLIHYSSFGFSGSNELLEPGDAA